MNEERLQDLFSYLRNLSHIKAGEIPDIDLYMGQVIIFMDSHLKDMRHHPGDKVLTKTMISSHVKNDPLPPPVREKHSKDHILMLMFIYCFKNFLSFSDIEEFFRPITSEHFSGQAPQLSLGNIHNEVFTSERGEMNNLKSDVAVEFTCAQNTLSDTPADDRNREYLKLFAFIYELSFDVHLKTQTIEMIVDQSREDVPTPRKRQVP